MTLDKETLQKHIDATLQVVPKQHNHAIVGYATTEDGGKASLTYVYRKGDHWTFGAEAAWERAEGFAAGGYIRGSW